MHANVTIDFGLLYSFMIVLARVSGFLLFVPFPGFSAAPASVRIVLSLALSACLMSVAPAITSNSQFGNLIMWVAVEFGLGLATGVCVAFLFEAFQIAGQAVGLQAGFSYASTVDPTTQADTGVLQTILQLYAGVLFFSLGLHLELFKLLTIGLNVIPDHTTIAKAFNPEAVLNLGSLMFTTGLRLAMPVIGSLMLIDLAFALLSKVHAQMQLQSFSFSVKMLVGLALFAGTLATCPTLLTGAAAHTLEVLLRLLK